MNAELLFKQLQDLLGKSKVYCDVETRKTHSHDYWLLDLQRRVHGQADVALPSCVVKAQTETDVCSVLAFANKNALAVVPYGAGSGVCAGARPQQGAIVLDLRDMNKVVSLNAMDLTVTVQPGMLGSDLESHLNGLGYSMGHFPQSIYLSSVGGWTATRASGQYSSKYGSIENMLVCLRAVLADGSVVSTKNVPRAACGPNVNEIFLGSEGSFAVVTELTYKVHPLPEQEVMGAFEFQNMHDGLAAVRQIMRAGYKPALCRLYDALDATRHFPGVMGKGKSLLLVLCEGPSELAQIELHGAAKIAVRSGGRSLGSEPVRAWKKRRFHIPNLQELAEEKGVVFDTIEIACNWSTIDKLYDDVIASLAQVPGLYMAYAHSSHSYQQGSCLYFSFAVKKPKWLVRQLLQKLSGGRLGRFDCPCDLAEVESIYNLCWQKVMEATLANGGTISHHHGIGKLRLPWIEQELGTSFNVLRKVKSALDPNGILNPGTIFSTDSSNPSSGSVPQV